MDAVRDDDRALVAETLARGESVTQTNAYGRTPLHKACYYSGAPAVIEELIRLGADVDAVDKGNWTCAHLAARNHHNDALAVLLSIRTEGAGTSSARNARRVNLAIADVKHGVDRRALGGDRRERGRREDAAARGGGVRDARQERRVRVRLAARKRNRPGGGTMNVGVGDSFLGLLGLRDTLHLTRIERKTVCTFVCSRVHLLSSIFTTDRTLSFLSPCTSARTPRTSQARRRCTPWRAPRLLCRRSCRICSARCRR